MHSLLLFFFVPFKRTFFRNRSAPSARKQALDALLSWRLAEEERIMAAAVEKRIAEARRHQHKVARLAAGIRQVRVDAKAKVNAAEAAAKAVLDARPELLGHYCACGRAWDCTACGEAASKALANAPIVPIDGVVARRWKASDWEFNGPAGPPQKVGPGRYDPQRADRVLSNRLCVRDEVGMASELGKTYVPQPFVGPDDDPATVWARSMRPADILAPSEVRPGHDKGHEDEAAAAIRNAAEALKAATSPTRSERFLPLTGAAKAAAAAAAKASGKEGRRGEGGGTLSGSAPGSPRMSGALARAALPRAPKLKGKSAVGAGGGGVKVREAAREKGLAVLRAHLDGGGSSVVSVKVFKQLLRDGGLKNATVKPWLLGPPPPRINTGNNHGHHGHHGHQMGAGAGAGASGPAGGFGTLLEADDYENPTMVCLGARGHLVNSPRYHPAPIV